MTHSILFALWFLLPAALANGSPIIAAKLPYLSELDQPIDGGRKFRGRELLGSHKTWRGLITGMIVAGLVFALQQYLFDKYGWAQSIARDVDYGSLPLILGPLFGFGALGGDAVESFFKRQNNVKSGQSWMPFDQIDYIVGAILVSLIFIVLPWYFYVWMLVLWFVIHIASTYVGWRLGLKKDPI